MKKIKISGSSTLLGVVLVFIIGCTDSVIEPPFYSDNTVFEKTAVDAVVVMDRIEFVINENLHQVTKTSFLGGTGKMNSSSGLDFTWEQSHLAYSSDPGIMIIQNGKFELRISSGDVLYGSYDGSGSYNDLQDMISADMQLIVAGGMGRFADSSGVIQAKLNPSEVNYSILQLELKGEILAPKSTAY